MYRTGLFLLALIFFPLFAASAFAHESSSENLRIIHMWDRGFNPHSIVINQGATIEFENKGKNNHWPASNIHPTHDIYPEFDPQRPIKPAESWSFTFTKPGRWRFHDHLSPQLSGTIIVRGNTTVAKDTASQTDERINLRQRITNLVTRFKMNLLDVYFSLFPEDKERYLSRQRIKRIVDQRNDQKLLYLLKLVGPEKVVAKLFQESSDGVFFNCHIDAHRIGRLSYVALGERALQKTIALCHSGYHHGVITAFIADKGTENLVTNLSKICEQSTSRFGKLRCYHGSGHGVMAYLDNNLPETISTCREYDSGFKQINCYAGAYMENIAARTGESFNPHKTQWLSSDPHFPCNKLEQDYVIQSSCYSIQPGWWSYLYKGDMDKIVTECLNTKETVIPSCFFGYGQQAALYARLDPKGTLALCEKVPKTKNYFSRCLHGAQMIVMDFWGPYLQDRGDTFCNVLPEQNKNECLRILRERKEDLSL